MCENKTPRFEKKLKLREKDNPVAATAKKIQSTVYETLKTILKKLSCLIFKNN